MTEVTPRLGIEYPDGTDFVSAYPTVAAQLAGIIDTAAIVLEGLLAVQPAASKYGRFYLATDTGQVFFDTGSAWAQIAGPRYFGRSFTMDDRIPPDGAAIVLGSFFAVPAPGQNLAVYGAVVHCTAVGSTPSVFQICTDHAAHGTLVAVAGLASMQPSTAQTVYTAAGGPMSLANLDRIAVQMVTPGTSLGCTVEVFLQSN